MANSLFMVDNPPSLDPHSKAKIVTFTLRDPYRYSVERKTAVDDKLKVKLFSHRHMGDTLKTTLSFKGGTVKPYFTDTSLLRTVCCVPGERKPLHFPKLNALNTDTP